MTDDTRRRRSPKGSRFEAPRKRSSGSARRAAGNHAKVGAPPSWSQLPLFVRDAFAFLPPDRTVQLPHDGMTLKLGSRSPVLIDSIEVPAAGANVSDEHVDVVEDDPALTSVRDDAIPHVCDSHDDGVSQGGLRLVSIGSYRRVASARAATDTST